MLLVTSVQAQYGPVGFVNYNDGINGITGGMGGNIVRVTNRTDLATYAGSATPYIIIVEGKMEGKGLSRTKDLITVNSNKTIVGVKGAELAGIGLDINGKQNIIIRIDIIAAGLGLSVAMNDDPFIICLDPTDEVFREAVRRDRFQILQICF